MKTAAFLSLEALAVWLADSVTDTLGFVVLLAAAIVGFGVIYQKVVKPIRRTVERGIEGVEIIFHIRDYLVGHDRRIQALEEAVHQEPPHPRAKRGLKSL